MTTAAPAPMPADAFLALAFDDSDQPERPGDEFGTYFVRKISAPALVEAIAAVAAKIARKLPDVVVTTYVDDYTGPSTLWCAEHRSFGQPEHNYCGRQMHAADRDGYYVPACRMHPAAAATVEVRVEGLPMWGAWGVGAILTRDAAGAVIATSVGARHDDETFARRYAHLMGECAHCEKFRNRNTTILLVNDETGEIRPVGKTCLTQYTGGMIRVEALAAMTSLAERFATEVGGVLTAEEDTAPTVEIVALAQRYIDLRGRYVRTNEGGPGVTPTADEIRAALFHTEGARLPAVMAADLTDADRARAAESIALIMREQTNNAYVLNVQEVLANDWMQITGRRNRVGIAASAPVAAQNIRDRVVRDKARAEQDATRVNAWIGTPKQRRNFVGRVVTARDITVQGYSGYDEVKTMLIIDTDEGTVKVFGNVVYVDDAAAYVGTATEDLLGKEIRITATIAPKTEFGGPHDEYKGHKQTKVQRTRITGLRDA